MHYCYDCAVYKSNYFVNLAPFRPLFCLFSLLKKQLYVKTLWFGLSEKKNTKVGGNADNKTTVSTGADQQILLLPMLYKSDTCWCCCCCCCSCCWWCLDGLSPWKFELFCFGSFDEELLFCFRLRVWIPSFFIAAGRLTLELNFYLTRIPVRLIWAEQISA